MAVSWQNGRLGQSLVARDRVKKQHSFKLRLNELTL